MNTAEVVLVLIIVILLYLAFDFFTAPNPNDFVAKWLKKFLWLWLPIYAFFKLIREVILKKK